MLTDRYGRNYREYAVVDFYHLRRLSTVDRRITEDTPHPRLFRVAGVTHPTDRPHTTYQPGPGQRQRTIDEKVVIAHNKTRAEQTEDDLRYCRLMGEAAFAESYGKKNDRRT